MNEVTLIFILCDNFMWNTKFYGKVKNDKSNNLNTNFSKVALKLNIISIFRKGIV